MSALRVVSALLWVLVSPVLGLAGAVTGHVYVDVNGNAVTAHTRPWDRRDVPAEGVELRLRSESGDLRSTRTHADGSFRFANADSGRHLVEPDLSLRCATHNCPRGLGAAVNRGAVNIVAFGDSNGTSGSQRLYPARLADHLAHFVDVDVVNVSVAGSTTPDWRPGTRNFEDRLRPALADADIVVFSLGGNDIKNHFGGLPPYSPEDIGDGLLSFPDFYRTLTANLREIIGEIRASRPEADIVYVDILNVADSDKWHGATGDLWPLVRLGARISFGMLRHELSKDPDLVLADVMGAVPDGALVDAYMADMMHPNDAGHQLFADEIFMALGGVMPETADPPADPLIFSLRPDSL